MNILILVLLQPSPLSLRSRGPPWANFWSMSPSLAFFRNFISFQGLGCHTSHYLPETIRGTWERKWRLGPHAGRVKIVEQRTKSVVSNPFSGRATVSLILPPFFSDVTLPLFPLFYVLTFLTFSPGESSPSGKEEFGRKVADSLCSHAPRKNKGLVSTSVPPQSLGTEITWGVPWNKTGSKHDCVFIFKTATTYCSQKFTYDHHSMKESPFECEGKWRRGNV